MMKTGKGGGIARTVMLPDEGESIYHMQLLQYVINNTLYSRTQLYKAQYSNLKIDYMKLNFCEFWHSFIGINNTKIDILRISWQTLDGLNQGKTRC